MRSRYWITVTLAAFAVYSVIATLGSVSTLAYWSHVRFDTDVEGGPAAVKQHVHAEWALDIAPAEGEQK